MTQISTLEKLEKGNSLIERAIAMRNKIYATAYRLVNNSHFAEDICQDVLLTSLEKKTQFDPKRGNLTSWLMQITKNHAIDLLRPSRRRVINFTDMVTDNYDNYDVSSYKERETPIEEDLEERIRIEDYLERLSDKDRLILVAYYFLNLNYRELSDLINIKEGTVKSRLYSAKQRLRKTISSSANSISF